MKSYLMNLLDVRRGEGWRVALFLTMGFFMGTFLASISVASQSLFLNNFTNPEIELPKAFLWSGLFGLVATIIYNFLQNRIPFAWLAITSLIGITIVTGILEFGKGWFEDPKALIFLGFTLILPFSFTVYLVFWGAFGRLFNLRQSKRLLGTVDTGAMVASFIAFFSIPQALKDPNFQTESLYTVSLISIAAFLVLFLFLSSKYLNKVRSFAQEKKLYKKIGPREFFKTRYIIYMAVFIIVSIIAINFINYSFLNVTTLYFSDEEQLASFISYFEMTIVIFNFLFQTLATDRIVQEYGMRVAMLINPILIGFFALIATFIGYQFGYSPEDNLFLVFFISIAMSKLFVQSLKDALDNQVFRLYLLPIESNVRIDVQTKIEGIVTAFATLIAAALIMLINKIHIFDLLSITIFTLPLVVLWFFIANRMHRGYRYTLQGTLTRNKEKLTNKLEKEYAVKEILEKGLKNSTEDKVIYVLKLMEKLEPALFENTLLQMTTSHSKKIKSFVEERIQLLGLEKDQKRTSIRRLAESAADALEDHDTLSISSERLVKLSKSFRQQDRILAAKLLRKIINTKTIFVLLELLRDADPKVRFEALITARKVKRPETWPVLIELLNSPTYSHHAAAALKETGESLLPTLEAAFHKSGQSQVVMLRIVQIMGRIGGPYALKLLWRKADYPDKRIVKQILYSLRYINHQAIGRQTIEVISLLDVEIAKAIWNIAALHELKDGKEFLYLREALHEELAENFDQIFMLLSILYEPQSVQLVRENISSGDPDSNAFALELLDLFIDPSLRPKLFPLFDDLPSEEKLRQLQTYFPRESYTPIQVINYILNRDFNFNNRWTKACAIHAAAFLPDFRISRGLIAQVFNQDKLLQETAAWVIYNKDQAAYQTIAQRLPQRDKKFLDTAIEKNKLHETLEDGRYLCIEMIMFLKNLNTFKHIHGAYISDLADKMTTVELDKGEKIAIHHDAYNSFVLIVAHGEMQLRLDNQITTLKRGDVYGDLFQESASTNENIFEALLPSVIFKINLMDFYFVMANHHELVQGIIKNVTGQAGIIHQANL